jgi:hypothetical protein
MLFDTVGKRDILASAVRDLTLLLDDREYWGRDFETELHVQES